MTLYIIVTFVSEMLTFVRRSTLQVIGGQWINQSFNAMVNYTNRNAKSNVTDRYAAVELL